MSAAAHSNYKLSPTAIKTGYCIKPHQTSLLCLRRRTGTNIKESNENQRVLKAISCFNICWFWHSTGNTSFLRTEESHGMSRKFRISSIVFLGWRTRSSYFTILHFPAPISWWQMLYMFLRERTSKFPNKISQKLHEWSDECINSKALKLFLSWVLYPRVWDKILDPCGCKKWLLCAF